MARRADTRALALELGASSAQGVSNPPPEPLDAAIFFPPAGPLMLFALEALAPGGILVLPSIHLPDIPSMDYHRHLFWRNKFATSHRIRSPMSVSSWISLPTIRYE